MVKNYIFLNYTKSLKSVWYAGLEGHFEGPQGLFAAGGDLQTWQRGGWDHGHLIQEGAGHW